MLHLLPKQFFLPLLMYKLSSTRFIIFDKRAKIIAEHQTEFEQILPHAGWHEHDPEALVEAMNECIIRAVEKLEWMGWSRNSVKGIGMYIQMFLPLQMFWY